MGDDDKFDAIVVGAGPAGITAAYILAKKGLDVVVVERGQYPGAKNVFGGVLFTTVLNRLIPEFWDEAPLERHIKGIKLFLLSENNTVSIGVDSEDHNKPPYNNSFTVSRAKFDQWYAKKAEEAGAFIINDTIVDDLIWDDGKAVGVRTRRDDGDIYADVVILADGVNSILSEKAGLRKNYSPRQVSVGMKEVIELPREVIEDRFQVTGNEGIELKYMAGDATKGIWGGGNIYTNLDSISLVTWVSLEPLMKYKFQVTDIMEHFKNHPSVEKYIKGGKTIEYQAHLAPDGGYDSTPELSTNGLLVVGDAARLLNASVHYEGTNFAMASGEAAAYAVMKAKETNDFSVKGLSDYKKLLNASFVMKDLKRYRKMNHFAEKNPEFFDGYFNVITQMAVDFFEKKEMPKRQQDIEMIKSFRSGISRVYADESEKMSHINPMLRKMYKIFPLARFIWQSIKGGISFI
jgi:electron transfer flavoprotein-quinone oxidoreductase